MLAAAARPIDGPSARPMRRERQRPPPGRGVPDARMRRSRGGDKHFSCHAHSPGIPRGILGRSIVGLAQLGTGGHGRLRDAEREKEREKEPDPMNATLDRDGARAHAAPGRARTASPPACAARRRREVSVACGYDGSGRQEATLGAWPRGTALDAADGPEDPFVMRVGWQSELCPAPSPERHSGYWPRVAPPAGLAGDECPLHGESSRPSRTEDSPGRNEGTAGVRTRRGASAVPLEARSWRHGLDGGVERGAPAAPSIQVTMRQSTVQRSPPLSGPRSHSSLPATTPSPQVTSQGAPSLQV